MVVFSWVICLVCFLDDQNRVMTYQMKIERAKRVKKRLEEKNDQLLFSLESIYTPQQLLSKLGGSEYGYLSFPKADEVTYLQLKRNGNSERTSPISQ